MNFTREPIIETIVSPKDGHKILLRNSKTSNGPEYTVDAVEVVSFGSSLFYRSLERPQSFLVPVSDFELVEVRETRVSLKNAKVDKAIKIESSTESSNIKKKEDESKKSKKRSKKRRGERQGDEKSEGEAPTTTEEKAQQPKAETKPEPKPLQNPEASSAVLTQLFPPPASLISETMTRRIPPKAEENTPLPPADSNLDQIWRVKNDAVSSSDDTFDDDDSDLLSSPRRSLRKRVKKEDEAAVEKEIEETPASPTVLIKDPENQSPSDA